jgi:hypothetical protein
MESKQGLAATISKFNGSLGGSDGTRSAERSHVGDSRTGVDLAACESALSLRLQREFGIAEKAG